MNKKSAFYSRFFFLHGEKGDIRAERALFSLHGTSGILEPPISFSEEGCGIHESELKLKVNALD
jgi:hypothetical protein